MDEYFSSHFLIKKSSVLFFLGLNGIQMVPDQNLTENKCTQGPHMGTLRLERAALADFLHWDYSLGCPHCAPLQQAKTSALLQRGHGLRSQDAQAPASLCCLLAIVSGDLLNPQRQSF